MKQKQFLSKHIFTIIIILFLTSFMTWLLYPRTTSKPFMPVIEPLTTSTTDTSNNYTTTTQNNQQK